MSTNPETTPSVQRVCGRCGRRGVQQYMSARPDGTPATTGEAWVCTNEPACRRRSAGRTSQVHIEITPAIQKMIEVLLNDFGGENTPSRDVAPLMARAALVAALDVEEMARAISRGHAVAEVEAAKRIRDALLGDDS